MVDKSLSRESFNISLRIPTIILSGCKKDFKDLPSIKFSGEQANFINFCGNNFNVHSSKDLIDPTGNCEEIKKILPTPA